MSVTGTSDESRSPALSVREVGKRFGDRTALSDVSFDAYRGELVAVIGSNGAGKTTLLSILAGVQRASSGTVTHLAGEIGWVPQQPALYSKLSVRENLRLFARLEKVTDPEGEVASMLEQTDLAHRAEERVANLSGGTRQRVNVALGLLADPPVLLLDEPSSALDPAQRERLWELVVRRADTHDTCILFSTHIVWEAERCARRVVVLDEGRLLFDGPPASLAGEGAGGGDFEQAFVSFLRERRGARA